MMNVQSLWKCISLSLFEYGREEYVNNVIKGREQDYSEEDIENLKQDYDNLKNRMLESFYHMERLRNIEKLYKVNEKKLTISNVQQLNEKESVFDSLKDLKMDSLPESI